MSNSYGPWATSINVGQNPQLSAFWKRRMSRLSATSQTSLVLSRRNLLWLGAGAAITAVLPTLRLASAMAEEGNPAEPGKKPSAGRIYLCAHLMTKPKADNKREEWLGDVQAIIAVDPETGRWEKIVDGDDVRVSPDGKTLAFAKYRPEKGGRIEASEIWTYDLATRRTNRLLAAGGNMFFWSPDGKRIVHSRWCRYDDDDNSQYATSEINVDGSGEKKLSVPETDEVEDWSSDGKWFVAMTNLCALRQGLSTLPDAPRRQ